jgi:hypothetical protein
VSAAALCLGLALPSASAGAQEPPQEDVAKQIAALQQQLQELQARVDAAPQASDVQGVVTDLENFKYQYQRERETKSALSTRNLLLGGVVQTRAAWYSADVTSPVPGNIAASSVNNPPFLKGRRLTFDVPSAILQYSGLLYRDYQQARNLGFSLSASASPATSNSGVTPNTNAFLSLLDANVTYQLLPTIENDGSRLSLTFGQQLVPFGLEANTTEELRPVINSALFVGASNTNGAGTTTGGGFNVRQIGLIARGELFAQYDFGYNYRQALLSFAAGILNGTGPNRDDDNYAKDLIGRVALTIPAEYNSWLRELRFGASYYRGRSILADTSTSTTRYVGVGKRDRWGADLYYNHWPLGVTLEYARFLDDAYVSGAVTTIKRHGRTATAFYSFGQQFLGSVRNQAKYDDWWPKTFQPFVRYDFFDPDTSRANDRIEIVTLGFNVFFAETTKAQINVNRRSQEIGPSNHRISQEFLGQVQFGF